MADQAALKAATLLARQVLNAEAAETLLANTVIETFDVRGEESPRVVLLADGNGNGDDFGEMEL